MRTYDEIMADAHAGPAFSNSTEFEIWAANRGCHDDCANDDEASGEYCPILSAALSGVWPKEWTRRTRDWQIGDASGSYEVVDACSEYDERPDDDGPDDDPEPDPGPPPVIEGQLDLGDLFDLAGGGGP